ncbi:hypothetical protein Ciccas_013338 [Cichlidogyrus casuarinus]|uniref:Uncharacterized protein n=1 Tax=Cichlidogyrus casuarinus TaxID=1844966 RepID=A0ABD2PLD1_9PLAT
MDGKPKSAKAVETCTQGINAHSSRSRAMDAQELDTSSECANRQTRSTAYSKSWRSKKKTWLQLRCWVRKSHFSSTQKTWFEKTQAQLKSATGHQVLFLRQFKVEIGYQR